MPRPLDYGTHALPPRTSWDNYRWRLLLVCIAFFGAIPVAGCGGMFIAQVSERAAIALAVGWLGFFGVSVVWVNSFPCPRCRRPFFHRPFVQNPLARRCMHCDWPKWKPYERPADA